MKSNHNYISLLESLENVSKQSKQYVINNFNDNLNESIYLNPEDSSIICKLVFSDDYKIKVPDKIGTLNKMVKINLDDCFNIFLSKYKKYITDNELFSFSDVEHEILSEIYTDITGIKTNKISITDFKMKINEQIIGTKLSGDYFSNGRGTKFVLYLRRINIIETELALTKLSLNSFVAKYKKEVSAFNEEHNVDKKYADEAIKCISSLGQFLNEIFSILRTIFNRLDSECKDIISNILNAYKFNYYRADKYSKKKAPQSDDDDDDACMSESSLCVNIISSYTD